MCVVSMIFDHYHDKWKPFIQPTIPVVPYPYQPIYPQPFVPVIPVPSPITPEEIEDFRRLLERAREYDKRNNEPECESEEKRRKVKELADALGVPIDFL